MFPNASAEALNLLRSLMQSKGNTSEDIMYSDLLSTHTNIKRLLKYPDVEPGIQPTLLYPTKESDLGLEDRLSDVHLLTKYEQAAELLYFRIYYGVIAKLKQLQETYGVGSKPLLDLALKRYQDEIQEAKRLYKPSIVSTVSGMLKSLKKKV